MVPRVPELPGDERSGRPGRAGHRPGHAKADELRVSSFSPQAARGPVQNMPQMDLFRMHQTGLVSVRVPVLPRGAHKLKPLKSMYLLSSSWAVSVARRVMKWDGGGRVTSLENRGL